MHPEADSCDLNVPGWHSEQIPAPDKDIVPAGQLRHCSCEIAPKNEENVFGLHGKQLLEPGVEL